MNNLDIGRIGEDAAVRYLQTKNYKIVERNYRTRWFEIDIIAHKGHRLVFVEVRTKNNEEFGTPEETIDSKKLNRVVKAAQGYIAFRAPRIESFQIDAICVVLCAADIVRISHYENITL